MHIQSVIKKMQTVDDNTSRLEEKNDRRHAEVDSLRKKYQRMESVQDRMEERLSAMEGQLEGQAERIVELQEEIAVLRSKKECKCSEAATSAVGSGSQHCVRATFTLALSSAGCNRSGPTAEGTCSPLLDNLQGAILW